MQKKDFIKEIREARYRFVKQTRRSELYKRTNPIHYIWLPRRKVLTEKTVASIRRQIQKALTLH